MSAPAPREGWRRAVHLASGSLGFAAFAFPLPHRTMTVLLTTLLIASVLIELLRRFVPAAQRGVEILSLGAMRPGEQRGILGSTMLLLGYLLAWVLFPGGAAACAIMVTAAADPAAALVGTRLRKERGTKTFAGTAAAFLAALVVLLASVGLPAAFFGSVAAALAERAPGPAVDNLALPLVTGAVLSLMA